MKSVFFLAFLLVLVAVLPQRASAGLFGNGKKKKEKKEAAERDVAMGLQGMQQAVNDPAMLAQLMKDMQDPEMMEEAKKMMESKEFKQQMKKVRAHRRENPSPYVHTPHSSSSSRRIPILRR